jgi:UDP-2,4-diacetamido-2,4,6-trideoxy-beta-L-altropyranose hydrolase
MKNIIGFRFDGNNFMGMGHVFRCLNIIEELRTEELECVAIVKEHPDAMDILDEKKIKVYKLKENLSVEEEAFIINKMCKENNIKTIVIDKLNSDPNYIRELKNELNTVISLDDCGEGSLLVDVLINAIMPTQYDYVNTKVYKGSDYIALNRGFIKFIIKEKEIKNKIRNVLLTFGGSDPKNITVYAINELSQLDDIFFSIVVGPAYKNIDNLRRIVKDIPNCSLLINTKNMPELIYNSDLCLTSGGITLYETAALGTPSIVICQVEHQEETAKRFEKDGVALDLGLVDDLKGGEIIEAFNKLNNNINLRQNLSCNGKRYVDGKGLCRIKTIIREAIQVNREWP